MTMNKSQDRIPYLPHNLRTVREILGISQCEMAEKLYIDRSTYSYYETGKSEPPVHRLKKIIDLFNSKLGVKKVNFEMLISDKLDYLNTKKNLLG
ncbi:MAG: helix-turn-helix domain-containing protein [Acutalibacteraceae bacterium]